MGRDVLEQDLNILERMVSYLGEYLLSEETHWEMREPGMPKLTIGGCLMRLHRLHTLQDQLSPTCQEQLNKVTEQFETVLQGSIVRFEEKTHQELHARLHNWVSYFADLSRHMLVDQGYFADKVDTRVVITAMVDKMQTAPYNLQGQIKNEVISLDNNLRQRWQTGAFIWDATWQAAYPVTKYWFLYGMPK
ncbi:MAG: hypothetical protein H6660_03565 [Ardenticatenaceae bacterium]|nr:hypothetical protein [Ardenticatenaceae bacterium]